MTTQLPLLDYLEYLSPFVDRSGWKFKPGHVVHDEPDIATWKDRKTGYVCLAYRGHMGSWCGYVGVPVGHVSHGVGYAAEVVCGTQCHGGLTYAGSYDSFNQYVKDAETTWFFGFDCAHGGDYVPFMDTVVAGNGINIFNTDSTYRTLEYVKSEITELADQLHKLDANKP